MRVMTIFGTRPEMIKLWSVMIKLDALGYDHITVHTGQNFSPELKDFFFRDLELRAPDYQLGIDTSSYGREVADVIRKSDDLMAELKPDALLILGDTYSGLSVMPAVHRGIKVYHMEAGLRAWDSRMPEQRNRILIDHMSHVNLPFQNYHRDNLLREGIHPSRIFVTGNTTFEAMRAFRPKIDASPILQELGLEPDGYVLATAHRSEAVDSPHHLSNIVKALGAVAKRTGRVVLFSVHPRTASKLTGYDMPPGVRVTKPFGFFDFNKLMIDCHCFLSDSGTAPEEALFYQKPCVTLRMAMERPETIEAAGTIVSGLEPEDVVQSVLQAVALPHVGRYELEHGFDPSTVVLNILRSRITNFF
jgi:UDP-N-acetylglucosamine 2-epimerase (non-hydrolysing)